MEATFDIRVVDDTEMNKIREQVKRTTDLKIDNMLVVEGCLNDDKTILGGTREFISHFCTFFEFGICYSQEFKPAQKLAKKFNDPAAVERSLELMLERIDKQV